MARKFMQSKRAPRRQAKANMMNANNVYKQVGKSNKVADMSKKAFKPGWRVSGTGGIYFENRKNRSDKKGSKV